MANYLFKTPVALEGPTGGHRLFYFRKSKRGITIVKIGSTYSQVRYALDADLQTYTAVYKGGYNHIVNDAIKAELIAGGVGVTEANFTAL
jgi:hypothetical protein